MLYRNIFHESVIDNFIVNWITSSTMRHMPQNSSIKEILMGSSDSDLQMLDNATAVISAIAGILGGVAAALGLAAFVGANGS